MVKNIPINPNLSAKRCWVMVNRADTHEKIRIAEEWLTANKVITMDEYGDMMDALAFISRELYRA